MFFRFLLWNLVNRKRYADGTLAMEKARRRTLFDYEHCDAYTVLCQDYKCQLERSLALSEPSHIHVIENPEPVVASPNLDKEKVVMFCGRFEAWSKRIDRLLRIWKQVEDELAARLVAHRGEKVREIVLSAKDGKLEIELNA